MKICVYTIAKNEIKEIDSWYETIKEADKIIVVDTGSSDGTPDKLESLGVEVHRIDYGDSFRFDKARHDSLMYAYATDCDVFMAIDFDEKISAGWADIIRKKWDPNKHTRGCCDFLTVINGRRNPTGGVLNWIHNREWDWKYPVHEVMVRKGELTYYHDECLNLCGEITIDHIQDYSKSRTLYLPLLRIRLEENMNDDATWAYYARELMYAAEWEELAGIADRCRDRNFNGICWAWVLIWTATGCEKIGDLEKAKTLLIESIKADPVFRTSWIGLARLLSDEGKDELAEGLLKQALASTVHEPWYIFQDAGDAWSWLLYDWISVVCYKQGRYDEAIKWCVLALDTDPNSEHLKSNYEACLFKLKNGG